MCVGMCFYMYLCIFVNITIDKTVSLSGFIYTGVSRSIYFCLVPDATASVRIAYNRDWYVNSINLSFYTLKQVGDLNEYH